MNKVDYSETTNFDFLLDLSMTRTGEEVVGLPSEGLLTGMRVNRNNENEVTSFNLMIVEREMLDALLATGKELKDVLPKLKEHIIKVAKTMAPLEDLIELDNSGYDVQKQPKIVTFEGLKGEPSLAVSAKNKPYIRHVNVIATNYTISEYEVKKK